MKLPCDKVALDYLSKKDKKLAAAIARIGVIERHGEPDVFVALVQSIIGQQISGAARDTICRRLNDKCRGLNDKVGTVSAESLLALGADELQSVGISHKKTSYILGVAEAVADGRLDLDRLDSMTDDEVIKTLSALKGVGVWTAEMLLMFSLGRMDVMSFGDLGIQRGLRMLYRHKTIDKERFNRYKKRYSPYASVASLYLWRIADGALAELSDPAIKVKNKA